jgi:hypothetical protein
MQALTRHISYKLLKLENEYVSCYNLIKIRVKMDEKQFYLRHISDEIVPTNKRKIFIKGKI